MEKREIKFRAWDGKKMYLPQYSDKEDFHLLADGSIVETHEHGYERHEMTSYRDSNWSVMQYTGLKDKNGVDIYEGDIVDLQEYDGVYRPIVFHKGSFCVHGFNWNNEKCEVIGNIYQDESLLK